MTQLIGRSATLVPTRVVTKEQPQEYFVTSQHWLRDYKGIQKIFKKNEKIRLLPVQARYLLLSKQISTEEIKDEEPVAEEKKEQTDGQEQQQSTDEPAFTDGWKELGEPAGVPGHADAGTAG